MKTCQLCGTTVEGPAAFCPQCGNVLAKVPVAPSTPTTKWYHNIWVVLGMLLMLGPFGLPLVWKNPRLSRSVKWLLTMLTVVATIWLVLITLQMSRAVINELNQFNATLQF